MVSTAVMESQQLGQIRGDRADHPGGRMQLCNGSENGDKAPIEARGDVFRSDRVSSVDTSQK